MKKNQLRGIAVLGILLIVFVVISFVVPFAKTGAFWVAFVFGIIALAVSGAGCYLAFQNGESAKSKFYGFPIAKIAVVYAVVQILVSFVFMAMARILPTWVSALSSLILLAATAIGLIAADAVREEIVTQDVKLEKNTENLKELRVRASSIAGLCEDGELKQAAQKLADEFRYSDPVSSEATAHMELEMMQSLDELQKAVAEKNSERAAELCKQVSRALGERNRICKLKK